jgi:hypothetical protein
MTAWSYSSIKTFDQCPKKYFHLKVVKDVKDEQGAEALYGDQLHKAAELYIKDGTPIPPKFSFVEPFLVRLNSIPGEKHAELKLGVAKTDAGFEPRGFFGKDVWYRGIIDLLIVNGPNAWLVDYKTGKNAKYADMKQLDLMAGAVFAHFPEVQRIKSALLYVVSQEIPRKVHVRGNMDEYFSVFSPQLEQLQHSMDSGVFNPKSGPLCGWCPVTACEHWRRRK